MDESIRALRRIASGWRPDARIYWADLAVSALIGWASLFGAVFGPLWLSPLLAVASAFALWRAAYFIHEIVHLKRGAVPFFELGWHVLVGFWVALPAVMVDAHLDHHRPSTYGTSRDPEYERVATWGRAHLVASALLPAIVPPLLVLRWGVLGPIGWLLPPFRRFLIRRASTLATNATYVRALPTGRARTRFAIVEVAQAAVIWVAAMGVWFGVVAPRLLLGWWLVLALALVMNQVRTLVAHRYENDGSSMAKLAQIADTYTFGGGFATELFAPVGNRHHAMHHLLPQLPYHHLPRAHRLFLEMIDESNDESGYASTISHGVVRPLESLWRSARRRGRASKASLSPVG